MKTIRCILILFLANLSQSLRAEDSAPRPNMASPNMARPNILMIAIDDLNDWVQPLGGHPQAKTPAIKSLADRGVLFRNAHCQSPLCNPSRTSVMTSLRPSTTGVYGLAPWIRDLEPFRETKSLPQFLESQGYETYSCGKVYHGWQAQHTKNGNKHEFQHWGPGSGPGRMPKEKLVGPTPNGNNPWVDWGLFGADEDRADWKCAEWAEAKLANMPAEKPFFLAVGFFHPHVPCYVSQKWWDMFPEKELILPTVLDDDLSDCSPFSEYLHWRLPEPKIAWLREHKQHKNLVRSYLAATSFVDSQVQRVLDALDHSTHRQNTIVVLWSDHGYHLGEKGMTGKTTLWERSTRVPVIFAGPGIKPGVCDEPAELLDLYPTLVELIDAKAPEHVEGISLLPQLNDPAIKRRRPAVTTHNPGNFSVRGKQYRLIHYADGSEELYDLKSDPAEQENLIIRPESKSVAERLRKWVPSEYAGLAEGSKHRVLEKRNDGWYWEGELIPE
jgi:arylsulfatase A-like enzyme